MTKQLLYTGPSPRGWHRLETAGKCLFLYKLKYVENLEFPPTMPLVRGTIIHIGLAHHYEIMRRQQQGISYEELFDPHEAMDAYVGQLALASNAESGNEVLRRSKELAFGVINLCHDVLYAYQAHFESERTSFEILGAEIMGNGKVAGKYRFTQRYDLVYRNRANNRVYFLDHKGVYYPDAKTLDRYTLSGQFIAMHYAGPRLYRGEFGGVMLNRLGFTEPFKFERSVVPVPPFALANFETRVVETEEAIERSTATGRFPMALAEQTCVGPYGRCDAFELCRWGIDHAKAVGLVTLKTRSA